MSAADAPPVQDSEARHAVATDVFVPWIERIFPLAGKRVLEYGSGNGCVSCAVAAAAGSLIGYDIDDSAVQEARERAAARRLENARVPPSPPPSGSSPRSASTRARSTSSSSTRCSSI